MWNLHKRKAKQVGFVAHWTDINGQMHALPPSLLLDPFLSSLTGNRGSIHARENYLNSGEGLDGLIRALFAYVPLFNTLWVLYGKA